MNTVGRIGSYIGRGVSSVSGTFHPFGGAVDIIVVEQPDGTLKSSPWYVRFGKFQGVLKAKEKVVNITVNGVEASFHMYLDSRGQAYFVKELDLDDGDCLSSSSSSSSSSSGEDTDGQTSSKRPTRSKSCKYDVSNEDVLVRANSRRPGILGMVFRRKSMKNDRSLEEDTDASFMRADSLERAEIAADLLEMRWSTNLTPKRYSKEYATRSSAQDTSEGTKEEDLQINDGKSDASSLAHDKMLDNLDFSDSGCEKDDGSHLNFQTVEKSVKENGKHVLYLASENATEVSTVVQSVEDYGHEERLRSSGDVDELGVVNCDHHELGVVDADQDTKSSTFISDVTSSSSQVVGYPELEKHDSFTARHLLEDEVFSFETEVNSAAVLDVLTEQVTQNSCISRGENQEVCKHAQTVLSVNDLTSEENSQAEENLLVDKDPSNVQGFEKNERCFKDLTNKSYSNSTSHALVSESGSLNSSAVGRDFRSILPILCSSSSACEDQVRKTSITDKATNKLEASLEALGDPRESRDSLVPLTVSSSESSEEEQLLFGDIDDCGDTLARYSESIASDYKETIVDPRTSSGCPDRLKEHLPNYESGPTLDKSIQRDPPFAADGRKLQAVSSNVDIPTRGIVQDNEITRMAISLPNMSSRDNNLPSNPDELSSSILLQTTEVAEVAEEVKYISATSEIENDSRSVSPSSGRWRSWSFSFKRSRSLKNSGASTDEDVINSDAKSISNNLGGVREKDVPRPKISKKKIMLTTPTTEQLTSLNLKEGKNIVVFTFSTAMLGKQQVDARIYLWRWDAKIVISDVDGTITRSDVLGQFMPLVGMDWSQTGVTHLFSAIKENGYHLLFLSARAISQAYLTRQFLLNLMQNGKGLPEGPVLTSPDGIFPSLFREVVRRAPHEFKIACLQDVKALFPSEKNPYPFYAGFGNRRTDEISYVKVGIPKGKIFTINPKGQIVVNCHIDTKSYTSIHSLVNGMFPAMSSEQEDFNLWNYWKLPLPPID